MKAVVAFGRDHNILICHDNPYSFILNDAPQSIFNNGGIEDDIIELTSLSKSHNMAGWRVGAMVARQELLAPVIRFKSNMDSGMFKPLQLAAAEALTMDTSWYDSINAEYRKRRTVAYNLMDTINCTYDEGAAGMFVWAKTDGKSGEEVSDRLLNDCGVFITPGMVFGTQGNDYIRISLCSPVEVLSTALNRIKAL